MLITMQGAADNSYRAKKVGCKNTLLTRPAYHFGFLYADSVVTQNLPPRRSFALSTPSTIKKTDLNQIFVIYKNKPAVFIKSPCQPLTPSCSRYKFADEP
jgi:hypothetical protein